MEEWGKLEIDVDSLDCKQLLSDWRWLVPQTLRPFSLTKFGDWFFEDRDGHVFFLDIVAAKLSKIAASRQSFMLDRAKPHNLDEWYMVELARLCWENGLRPESGQCLGFKIPTVLNGALELKNIEVIDMMVYESTMAQIHRGVKDLPAGTMINKFSVQ